MKTHWEVDDLLSPVGQSLKENLNLNAGFIDELLSLPIDHLLEIFSEPLLQRHLHIHHKDSR